MEDRYKAIVLFTGGLDSLACYFHASTLFSNVGALYVDLGTVYSQVEMHIARSMCESRGIPLKIVPLKFMGEASDAVGHVPLRNLFLLEIAALYGDNIFFGMLHGELTEDKGFPFVKRMQGLFDSQTIRNLYHDKYKITIHAPFGKKTKTEVIAYLMDRGVSRSILRRTIGCLQGTVCGECSSCFNRWVGFENNGLYDVDIHSGSTHPAEWGLKEFHRSRTTKNTFRMSLLKVPILEKRKWLREVWKAYDSYSKRTGQVPTPGNILKSIIGELVWSS